MTFIELIALLKNLAIARSFYTVIQRGIRNSSASKKVESVKSLKELKEAYFNSSLGFGDQVKIDARLSQYCPIYFPIAYSPQVVINRYFEDGLKIQPQYNPSPTSINLKGSDGSVLCFLFNHSESCTPTLRSKYHLDRTSQIPYGLSQDSIPILIDPSDFRHVDQIVQVVGTLIPLDSLIASAIQSSDDDMIRLFYHSFYNSDFFPNRGFMIDGRRHSGGSIRSSNLDPSQFYTSISIETQVQGSLSNHQIQEIIQLNFKNVGAGIAAGVYRPAYYEPGGYEIVQFNINSYSVHYAPSLGVLNSSVHFDTTNPDPKSVTQFLFPVTRNLHSLIAREDKTTEVKLLFSSDPTFRL